MTRRARAATPAVGEAGQSSVELLALLPLAALIALAIGQLLAAGAARELAGNAAEAGAAALLQQRAAGDPATAARVATDASRAATAAARAALPGWSRDRATVHVSGRRVEVRVRPRTVLPGLAGNLAARAAADAGPPA